MDYKSKKIQEFEDKYGCENLYTIVSVIAFLFVVLGMGCFMAAMVWIFTKIFC
jgi:hypothetical protein